MPLYIGLLNGLCSFPYAAYWLGSLFEQAKGYLQQRVELQITFFAWVQWENSSKAGKALFLLSQGDPHPKFLDQTVLLALS